MAGTDDTVSFNSRGLPVAPVRAELLERARVCTGLPFRKFRVDICKGSHIDLCCDTDLFIEARSDEEAAVALMDYLNDHPVGDSDDAYRWGGGLPFAYGWRQFFDDENCVYLREVSGESTTIRVPELQARTKAARD